MLPKIRDRLSHTFMLLRDDNKKLRPTFIRHRLGERSQEIKERQEVML